MKMLHRFVSNNEIAAARKAFLIQAKEILKSTDCMNAWTFSNEAGYFVKRWEPLIDSTTRESLPDIFRMSARLLSKNIEVFKNSLSRVIETVEQRKVDDAKMIEAIDHVQSWNNYDRETTELIKRLMNGAGQAPSD